MAEDSARNIVLIGMPGSGKSTLGVLLAKNTGLDFVDTDVLIQVSDGRSLQDILDREGFQALRDVEEKVLLALDVRSHVVATGGSAAYSDTAMAHLKEFGTIVFLDVPLKTLENRVSDLDTRGIAAPKGTTFEDLYNERLPLYRRWADITVTCGCRGHEDLLRELATAVLLDK